MIKIKKEFKHFLRIFFLIFLIHSPDLFSQDFEVTSVNVVGGNSFCKETSPKNLTIVITNKTLTGAAATIPAGQIFRIFVNGTNPQGPYNLQLTSGVAMATGGAGTTTINYTTDLTAPPDLLFPNPGINTVTVSMTWTGGTDPVPANNVSSTTNLTVFNPVVFSLSPSASSICQGESVTYTINGGDNPTATATYTFRKNGGVVQSIMGNNVMTFAPGTISDKDIVTIDVMDGQSNPLNGCVVDTSTISATITVNSATPASLVSNSTPSLTVCAGETIVLTAGPTGSGETYAF